MHKQCLDCFSCFICRSNARPDGDGIETAFRQSGFIAYDTLPCGLQHGFRTMQGNRRGYLFRTIHRHQSAARSQGRPGSHHCRAGFIRAAGYQQQVAINAFVAVAYPGLVNLPDACAIQTIQIAFQRIRKVPVESDIDNAEAYPGSRIEKTFFRCVEGEGMRRTHILPIRTRAVAVQAGRHIHRNNCLLSVEQSNPIGCEAIGLTG